MLLLAQHLRKPLRTINSCDLAQIIIAKSPFTNRKNAFSRSRRLDYGSAGLAGFGHQLFEKRDGGVSAGDMPFPLPA
jgi:hypothetical protein